MTQRKTAAKASPGTAKVPAAPKAGAKAKAPGKPKAAPAPEAKPEAMPAPRRRVAKKPTQSVAIEAAVMTGRGQDRLGMVAVAAYYRAERRGFAPGGEMDDWLEAEAEIERLLAGR